MRMKPRTLMLSVLTVIALALLPGIALAEDGDLTAAETSLTAQGYPLEDTGNATFNAFINDGRYTQGVAWSNCYTYAQAFTGYCYGNSNFMAGSAFSNAGEVRAGDVIWINSSHYFAVLKRSGNSLYVAEGNYLGHVEIRWGYTISGNLINGESWTGWHWGSPTPSDQTGPSYSDFHVGEIMDGQFTVMAKVTDPSGIKSVRYAVWTDDNGQDELVWYDGHCTDGNGYYWARVPFSEHKGEKGKYTIHMYATDNANNTISAGISYRFDAGNPVIEGFHTWELKDNQFTVSATITSPNGIGSVRYAVWTEYNGQDDLVWYDAAYEQTGKFYWVYVPFSEHRNERGNYIIHLYAYDKGGKLSAKGISYVASAAVPSAKVAEGTYSFRSKLDTSMCLDVAGHSMDDKANAWLWK